MSAARSMLCSGSSRVAGPSRLLLSSQAARPIPFRALPRIAASSSSRLLSSSPLLREEATPAAQVPSSDLNKASATLKRFWKSVNLVSKAPTHHEIHLDTRALRTPSGQPLHVPFENELLARLIVQEWNEQSKVIKSHALPLTGLIARAIDGFAEADQRDKSIEEMLKYAETDTTCFHESDPKALVRLQAEHWDPILDWVAQRFGTRPNVAFDTLLASQPPQLFDALRAHLKTLSPLQLAALEKALHLTKSLFISVALLEGKVSVTEAMQAAWVETNAQVETWGEVEDSHDVGWAELGRELGAVRLAVCTA